MKKIFLMYSFLALLMLAVLSVLSSVAGSGYIYMLWFGVQIQTNIWVLMYSILLFSLSVHLFWLLYQHRFATAQRKLQQVSDFDVLHPYEQLGVIWMIEADDVQPAHIQKIFNTSGLLSEVIQARLLSHQGFYEQALELLEQSPSSVYELAELQKIEIYLNQLDSAPALDHLVQLSIHKLSPWLISLESSYQQRIVCLWGKLALQSPWEFLKAPSTVNLDSQDMQIWLTQLLLQFDQTNSEQLAQLKQKYLMIEDQIPQFGFEAVVLWLKLITRHGELLEQQTQLALHLLDIKFDQDVFLLWFQHQLMLEDPQYSQLESYISKLQLRYPSLPILNFAQWHIYTATDRLDEADRLLSLYPDNIFMSYLRIKSALSNHVELLEQLKLIFENDAKFIEFKI